MMREQSDEAGFDVLDVLILIAENIKLLILGPLVAGLLGLAVAYSLPKTFTSRAVLALPNVASGGGVSGRLLIAPPPTASQAATIIVSPLVLDQVIASSKLGVGSHLQLARAELSDRVKATVGKDFLLRVDVSARAPDEALATANAVIDAWFKSTRPGPIERESLEKRLAYAKTSLDSVRRQLAKLIGGQGSGNRDDSTSLALLSELESRYAVEVVLIERALEGVSREVIVQEPTLPLSASAPQKRLIVVSCGLLAGLAIFFWILIFHAWRQASQNLRHQSRQARLLTALGVNRKKTSISPPRA